MALEKTVKEFISNTIYRRPFTGTSLCNPGLIVLSGRSTEHFEIFYERHFLIFARFLVIVLDGHFTKEKVLFSLLY